jgi:hypothetical protein
MNRTDLLIAFLASALPAGAMAQPDLRLALADGTEVVLVAGQPGPGAPATGPSYYYLPVNLRIAERDGQPEFSFTAWRADDRGPVEGAVLHVLMTWGLTAAQGLETAALLRSVDSTAVLAGALPVEAEDPGFTIRTDIEIGAILQRSLRSAGAVPTLPDGKIALAFMLSGPDAERFQQLAARKGKTWETDVFELRLRPAPWALAPRRFYLYLRSRELFLRMR